LVAELAPKFPDLEIIELIGRGGMGAVYRARQKSLERMVALKILPPEVGHNVDFTERFAREAQAMARLHHPHIVTIFDFGQRDGVFFFFMEYVDGCSLRQLMEGGKFTPPEALAIVPQICEALQYAHNKGVVHRDIKPDNILMDRDGEVKIADFGLAKLVGLGAARSTGEAVMGTPKYMAPEQISHPDEVDHRADIYALGVMFYQMLTGEYPGEVCIPPSRMVQVDVRLDEIVLRALERTPQLRFQSATEMQTQIQTVAHDRTPLRRAGRTAIDHAVSSPVTEAFEKLIGASGLKAVVLVAAIVGLVGVSMALARFFGPPVPAPLQGGPQAAVPIDSANGASTPPLSVQAAPAIIAPPSSPISGGPAKPTVTSSAPSEGIFVLESFDNNDFDHEKWGYDPLDPKVGKVEFTEGSLHYFAPPGPKGRPRFRLKSTFGIDGDFEASLDFDLIQFPVPEADPGDPDSDFANTELILGGPGGMIYFSRTNHQRSGDGFVLFHLPPQEPGRKTTWKFEPGAVTKGKLRIRRIDSELLFSYLPAGGSVYREVATLDYGKMHISSVSCSANVSGKINSPLEIRIDNLEAKNIHREVVRGPFKSNR
jgi:serine/threonine protein kinase